MISIKEQLRKSLLEVCTPEDLREWFDPLQLRYEPGKKKSSVETDKDVLIDEALLISTETTADEYEHSASESVLDAGATTPQIESEPGSLIVTLPHALFADWFDKKGRDLLESTVALFAAKASAENEDATSMSIRYEAPQVFGTEGSAAEAFSSIQNSSMPSLPPSWMHKKSGKDVTKKFPVQDAGPYEPRFEDFITNAKHRNILHILQSLLPRNPRSVSPVVLYGPPGSGKSHLLAATTKRLMETVGGAVLCSADEFDPKNFFSIHLEKEHTRAQIRSRAQTLTEAGGLIVDNMHRLPGHEAAQKGFIRLLEGRLEAGAPVLLAGTGRLAEWPLDDSLRSRLHAGVLLALPEADLDMCLRYAQQRARQRGLRIDRDALLDMARRFPDIRRLEGAMRRLEALSELLPADRNLTPQEVEQLASHAEGPGMTAQAVMHLVGDHLGVTARDMQGGGRKSRVVLARQMAMYLCRELLGLSFPVIGQLFGGKDHSTAIHAVRKIKQLQSSDSDTNILVTELTKRCRKLAE